MAPPLQQSGPCWSGSPPSSEPRRDAHAVVVKREGCTADAGPCRVPGFPRWPGGGASLQGRLACGGGGTPYCGAVVRDGPAQRGEAGPVCRRLSGRSILALAASPRTQGRIGSRGGSALGLPLSRRPRRAGPFARGRAVLALVWRQPGLAAPLRALVAASLFGPLRCLGSAGGAAPACSCLPRVVAAWTCAGLGPTQAFEYSPDQLGFDIVAELHRAD